LILIAVVAEDGTSLFIRGSESLVLVDIILLHLDALLLIHTAGGSVG